MGNCASCLGISNQRPQPQSESNLAGVHVESRPSPPPVPTNTTQTPGIADPSPAGHVEVETPGPVVQSQGEPLPPVMNSTQTPSVDDLPHEQVEVRETPRPVVQPQDGLSSTDMGTNGNEEMIITTIRATDVAVGLGRLPAGFHAVVHHNGFIWETENKSSSVNYDVVEWNDPIPIGSDPSGAVRLEVFASFEFQPMLGVGEHLRTLTTTVEELLDRSANKLAFTFFPKDEVVILPCSSISVTVENSKFGNNNPSASRLLNRCCLNTSSRGELEDVTNHGHDALLRYRKRAERRDLDHSIEKFEHALSICAVDHPCRAAAQSNLAMAKFILCQVENTDTPLEEPLQLYHNALAARPVGNPDRPSTLIQLAAVYLLQFQKQKNHASKAQAEALLHEAMEISPSDSHERRAAATMLQLRAERETSLVQPDCQSSTRKDSSPHLTDEDLDIRSAQLLKRFNQFGDIADLEQAIAFSEELVGSTSVGDDRYCGRQANLAAALSYRFDRFGEQKDLDNAISRGKNIVDLTPRSHHRMPSYLSNLGNFLITRFEHLGQLTDLEDAISILKDVVELTPRGHSYKPRYLNNLGTSFIIRFERLGQVGDLEGAVSTLREAVDLSPHDHPDNPACLSNLGDSFAARFGLLGQLEDLEDAISMHRDAVDLTPHGHPDKPGYLHSLGNSFKTRFDHHGQLIDLENAISNLRDAVDLTPHGHPHKPHRLNNLGNSFVTRFERLGQLTDLEGAISVLKDAAELIPHGHPQKPDCLGSLGNSLTARFECLGQPNDLEEAISIFRNVVELTSLDHPDKSGHLNNLGDSLSIRFNHLGQLTDLQDAISTLKRAVDLTPHGHPRKPSRLNNLGNSLAARFGLLGRLSDLEDAILMHRDAADLTPDGHPKKPDYLNNVGNSFKTRFEHLGQLIDLENAISVLRDAIDLTPDDHPNRPVFLCNLSSPLRIRFEYIGQLTDLEDAISIIREAVALIPHGHPLEPTCLTNLGNSLFARFQRLREPSDLEDAILAYRDAVDLTPRGHHDKPGCLSNLGNSFRARFEHLGHLNDLEDAISRHRDAVDHTPHGHADMPGHLHNLGNSFMARFEHLGELTDLEEAIAMYKHTIELIPHGHPDRPGHLDSLGNSLITRFERLGRLVDAEVAISLYSNAASTQVGSISVRFRASRNWISCARRISHPSLLHAYSVAIMLLPQLAWVGLSLTDRFSQLTRGADVVREAAAAALDLGFPETAVEWLEQGRSILWGELLHLRSSHEDLSAAHPEHARRLQELSKALETATATHETFFSAAEHFSANKGNPLASVEAQLARATEEAGRRRMLAIERDKLIQEIRQLSGFEQFLLRKPFSQLRASAHSGPIVILNAAETRCDALIVLSNLDHVIHVPLPNFTLQRSYNLQNSMKGLVRDMRDGKVTTRNRIGLESILSPLWKCVVKPVLDALAFSVTPRDLSRIFWCPTGPFAFLPIHAAGFYHRDYSEPGHKVFDFVVSSYVPTLASLAPSPNPTLPAKDDLRILTVGQPPSDGQSPLPGVVTELAYIKAVIENSPSARAILVESSTGTVEEVVGLMKDAEWVHFACHGVQDGMDSGLCLADRRRLKLRDIIALSRPHGGLAFLSACQTAKGDERLSDEAIHIAAGMLFAGYGGVIGTMWSISDGLAPRVARDIYMELFENGERSDYRGAARALHETMGRLRNQEIPFVEWVPFIHVGL